MERSITCTILLFLLMAALPAAVVGQGVPSSVSYQGKLTDSSGAIVPDGTYSTEFKLYDAESGGAMLWDSKPMSVSVTDGIFTVALQAIYTETLSTSSVWLETTVATTVLPRVKLQSVPFAIRSDDLVVPFSKSVSNTSTLLSLTNTGSGRAAYFKIDNTSSLNTAVRVDSNGQASAIWANSTGYGKGLYATSTDRGDAVGALNSGLGTAGRFQINNAANAEDALIATTSGTGNAGSFSITNAASTVPAIYSSTSGTGAGIEGYTTGTGYAGYFHIGNSGSNSPAVYALTNGTSYALTATNTTFNNYASLGGNTYSLYARSVVTSGIGVYGSCNGDSSRGVYGYTSGTNGYGLYGYASSSTGTGLYARGGSSGYSAILRGNVQIQDRVTGNPIVELGVGLDYAEGFDVSKPDTIKPGTVLVIDAKSPGKLALSQKAYDRRVAGIVAGAKGLGSGVKLGTGQFDHNVALAGRVYCNVDATKAAIEPGDLLTTANTPGYAMKVKDHSRAQGAILGKAMQGLAKGHKGQILVLVTLQ